MNIYISGPITGHSEAECEMKFNKAKKDIERRGHFAVSPWDISKLLPSEFDYLGYLAIDLEIVKRCDAVYFIDGWKSSTGCRRERGWCYMFDRFIFDDISEVPNERAKVN